MTHLLVPSCCMHARCAHPHCMTDAAWQHRQAGGSASAATNGSQHKQVSLASGKASDAMQLPLDKHERHAAVI